MSAFTAINLDRLPAPQLIDRSDFESILSELKQWLINRSPDLEAVLSLESEPIIKVLEAWAYRELLLRAEFDDATRGNLLAFATGAHLDHLAAFYGVERAVVQQADSDARPPIREILEDDTRFRARVQLALEGFTTAGPIGSYVFWGLSASPSVKDIGVRSINPGEVLVTVLASDGSGIPSNSLLQEVEGALNSEDVRPLCDTVVVSPATIVEYSLNASLTLYNGPDEALVRDAAVAAVTSYISDHHRLGHDITISGLHAALHQNGVQNVEIASPAADLVVGAAEAAYCTSLNVTIGGRDV